MRVDFKTLKLLARCYFLHLYVCVCVFFNRSARVGDAARVGHLSHHFSRVAGLCSGGLDIRLSLDEEKNSK